MPNSHQGLLWSDGGAGVLVGCACLARDGAGNAGKGKIQVRVIKRGAARIKISFRGSLVGQHLIECFLRNCRHLNERAVAHYFVAGVLQFRLYNRNICFRLFHHDAVGAWIDDVQHLPFADCLAIGEALRVDPSAHARNDVNGANAHGHAWVFAVDGYIADRWLDSAHWRWRHSSRFLWRARASAGGSGGQHDCCDTSSVLHSHVCVLSRWTG